MSGSLRLGTIRMWVGVRGLDVAEGGDEVVPVDDVGGDFALNDLRENGVLGHVGGG